MFRVKCCECITQTFVTRKSGFEWQLQMAGAFLVKVIAEVTRDSLRGVIAPKGLCHNAQGCDEGATLGSMQQTKPTRNGLRQEHQLNVATPFGVEISESVIPG